MKWTRLHVYLLVVGLWALIYLPGLGYLEIQGEEGRYMLPAVRMLHGASWVVPEVGGEQFYRKPAGINWIVAAAFKLTGRQDEWAARLPTTLFYLAFVTLLIWMGEPAPGRATEDGATAKTQAGSIPGVNTQTEDTARTEIEIQGVFLDVRARLAAAVVFLTGGALMEKGRLIEIEGIYVALTGLALVWWLNAFVANRSTYVRWVVPCLFLTLGALVKGPNLAIPFYAAVVCVLAHHRRLKDLFSPGHLIGIALILVLCLGWVALAMKAGGAAHVRAKWGGQLGPLYDWRHVNLRLWAGAVGMSFLTLLPWLFFLPMLWVRRFADNIPAEQQQLFRSLRLGLVIGFAGMCTMAALLPRYTLPAFPLACILIGWVLSTHRQVLLTDRLWRAGVLVVLAVLAGAALVGVTWQNYGVWARLAEKMTIAWQNNTAWGWLGLALCVAVAGNAWRFRNKIQGGLALTLLTGLTCGLVVLQYVLFVMPSRNQHARFRPAAAAVDAAVPADQTLDAYRPGYQPFLFYVHRPIRYLLDPSQIDAMTRYLLLEKDDPQAGQIRQPIASRQPRPLLDPPIVLKKPETEEPGKRASEFQLFQLNDVPVHQRSGPATSPDDTTQGGGVAGSKAIGG